MATATVETVTVKSVTLTLTEDEAQAILALTGKVGGGENATQDVYSSLNEALGFPYEGDYRVTDTYGGSVPTLYLNKR